MNKCDRNNCSFKWSDWDTWFFSHGNFPSHDTVRRTVLFLLLFGIPVTKIWIYYLPEWKITTRKNLPYVHTLTLARGNCILLYSTRQHCTLYSCLLQTSARIHHIYLFFVYTKHTFLLIGWKYNTQLCVFIASGHFGNDPFVAILELCFIIGRLMNVCEQSKNRCLCIEMKAVVNFN